MPAPIPEPAGPRIDIVQGVQKRLMGATPAQDRVYLNRTEPVQANPAGGEQPILIVHELNEAAIIRTRTAPKSYTRTLRIGVSVHVPRQPFTAGLNQMGQSLSASETVRRAEVCRAVEEALLADPHLETTTTDGHRLTGDCEYAGTQFSQDAASSEVALATALVLFDYTYVTRHEHALAIGAGPLDSMHVDYHAPAPQTVPTAQDDIALPDS